jgi:putative membrane protein
MDHGWWWGFGWVPLVLMAILIGVVVWAVLRSTRTANVQPAPPPPAPPRDPVIEEVRLRYARGEISREEFLQRTQDLSGVALASSEGPPPAAPAPSEGPPPAAS